MTAYYEYIFTPVLGKDGTVEVVVEGGILDGATGAVKASFSLPARWANSVCVAPGQWHVTVTPVPFNSWDSASEKDTTKALVAKYVAM